CIYWVGQWKCGSSLQSAGYNSFSRQKVENAEPVPCVVSRRNSYRKFAGSSGYRSVEFVVAGAGGIAVYSACHLWIYVYRTENSGNRAGYIGSELQRDDAKYRSSG